MNHYKSIQALAQPSGNNMQLTITIDDDLLHAAAQCLAHEDVNRIVNIALAELILNHLLPLKDHHQPPATSLAKARY